MKTWVLLTIITLPMVVTGADKLLNEACSSGDTCVDISENSLQLTCDVLVGRCLIKAGYACKETEDLCITGAYCKTVSSTEVKCSCAANYNENSGTCDPGAKQPGNDCDNGCIDDAVCSNGHCTCNVGFRLDENGECVAVDEHTVGATCTPDQANIKGDCDDENAKCSTTATAGDRCDCKDGYVGVVGSGCNVKPNKLGGRCKTGTAASKGSCEGDGLCSETSNGVCQCPQGHEGTEGDTVCKVMENKLGGSCQTNTAASKGTCEGDGVCSATSDGVCECPQGYEGKNGDTVCIIKPNKLGGSCTTNTAASKGSCEGDGVCSETSNGVCQCPQGYKGKNGDTVCKVSFNAQCTSGEECADDFAVCDPRALKCLIKAGESCSNPNTYNCVSNATCTEGDNTCLCDTNFEASNNGLCILQDEKGRAPRESSLSPLLTWFIGLCLALYVV